ncbi:unnamed protein product [Paramecium primaurelia]|uniref:RING-type domain-containing protein n=1 Tax=Paramecium primaurelia TaxID=5886 RepID=A0A8S1LIC3_PARPR|nr:unnamed protein product [Paramecium primaurelia]
MDVEQIELNMAPQISDQNQGNEQVQSLQLALNAVMQDTRQSYLLKKGRLQLQTLKRLTQAILIYRILYVLLCFIPFYKCPFECNNTLLNILLLICIGLELLKIVETIYQLRKVSFYLNLFTLYDAQQVIPFSLNDFQTIFALRYALDKLHKKAFYFRITINMYLHNIFLRIWVIYYIIYVAFFFSNAQYYTSDQNVIVSFMLIIISLDSVFFIFPYVFQFIGWFCFKCYDAIKKITSKNNKLLRSLKIEKYVEGQQLTDENICIICWDSFKKDEQYSRLKCNKNHIFHTSCIKVWIKTNITCPVCRAQLV